jgi:hypothetical protein
MPKSFEPIDLSGVNTYPLANRKSKVDSADVAKPWERGSSLKTFLTGLPNILAARDMRKVIEAITNAVRQQHTVLWGMGAHLIKVGLNPVVVNLMQRGVISAVAMNGAGIIHDLELAMVGRTSEDVAAALSDGSFGMARETNAFLSAAITAASGSDQGLGEAVGRAIVKEGLPHSDQSILAAGARLGIPVTVHVAFGTDILHMHPDFDPAAAGAASHRDFRLFAGVVATLEKGVYLNIGSAVLLPEVFLKALSLARNLGYRINDFTTVNLDFIQHYRPLTNVVRRPGGNGISLTGHHEIMVPLIAAGVIEHLE